MVLELFVGMTVWCTCFLFVCVCVYVSVCVYLCRFVSIVRFLQQNKKMMLGMSIKYMAVGEMDEGGRGRDEGSGNLCEYM